LVEGNYEVIRVVDPSTPIGDYSGSKKIPMCYPCGTVEVRSARPLRVLRAEVLGEAVEVIAQ